MSTEPPYRKIVAELRARMQSGELLPGDRMPSIRQISRRWGVAVATATRGVATLREEGLVEAKVGSGTVVSGVVLARSRPQRIVRLNRGHVLRAAIAIADAEGLEA